MLGQLGDLTRVQLTGPVGDYSGALIWLTCTSILMLVGPATGGMIYLLIRDRYDRIWPASSRQVLAPIPKFTGQSRKAA